MLTRSNVAYNLHISPHRELIPYGDDSQVEYVFSSDLYRRKFLEKQKANREEINRSLSNRFGFQIENGILADLRLYTTIEKRGFLLYRNGVEVVCPDGILLDGVKMVVKNSAE